MQALEGKYTDLNCKFVKFQNGIIYPNDCIKQSGQVVFIISDSSRKILYCHIIIKNNSNISLGIDSCGICQKNPCSSWCKLCSFLSHLFSLQILHGF